MLSPSLPAPGRHSRTTPAPRATAAPSSQPAPAAAPPPSDRHAAPRAALLARVASVPSRGVFGLPLPERAELDALLAALEAATPLPSPLATPAGVAALAGDWRLLYTTLSVRGGARTALGLRTGVVLGELRQVIEPDGGGAGAAAAAPAGPPRGAATTVVPFSLGGAWAGAFTCEATFVAAAAEPAAAAAAAAVADGNAAARAPTPPAPGSRVAVTLLRSGLRPRALEALLGPQLPLLLALFNPQGWLDTTYLEDSVHAGPHGALRVGRDDKGHAYLLQKQGAAGAGG